METPLEWNRIGSYALRSNYIRSFRTPKCLFFPWALECKLHCPLEAREKKLAHRDLLMGLRWSWIRCTFLDTIGYLGITEGTRRQRAQSLSEHRDQLMALTPAQQRRGWTHFCVSICLSVCLPGCCTWCCSLRDLPRWPQAEPSVNYKLRLHTAPVLWLSGDSPWSGGLTLIFIMNISSFNFRDVTPVIADAHHLSILNKASSEGLNHIFRSHGLVFKGADPQPKAMRERVMRMHVLL